MRSTCHAISGLPRHKWPGISQLSLGGRDRTPVVVAGVANRLAAGERALALASLQEVEIQSIRKKLVRAADMGHSK